MTVYDGGNRAASGCAGQHVGNARMCVDAQWRARGRARWRPSVMLLLRALAELRSPKVSGLEAEAPTTHHRDPRHQNFRRTEGKSRS